MSINFSFSDLLSFVFADVIVGWLVAMFGFLLCCCCPLATKVTRHHRCAVGHVGPVLSPSAFDELPKKLPKFESRHLQRRILVRSAHDGALELVDRIAELGIGLPILSPNSIGSRRRAIILE